MSSLRRINASRANGARSRGPVTPEGKARSAANAVRHGLLAQTVVLAVESKDLFEASLAGYIARFQPADDVELSLVEEMAVADWRRRRCWGIETCLFDQAANDSAARDAPHGLTAGYSALAGAPTFSLVNRYEARLDRMYQRALSNLMLLRKNQELPNEPNPISEHPGEALDNAPAPESDDVAPASGQPSASSPTLPSSSPTVPPDPLTPAAPASADPPPDEPSPRIRIETSGPNAWRLPY